ncbi:NADPH-dependent FMN reductase [Roseivirga pacifica]|uniref:NADPH-dependent FMN reductase n=1 Tax=Roseivirga pacifica TaxID=1267423 RepID=UPI003BAE7699
MKALIFNGALERRANSTPEQLSNHLAEQLQALGAEAQVFNIAESGIPLFDMSITQTPRSVERMNLLFREADVHIWLTPLYHGSMTGAMKNCLDWLEYSAKLPEPYLTGKMIGLVCWADGVQAMQGINAMDSVAKSLRAWTLPYSVPIQRNQLFNAEGGISEGYKNRFQIMLDLLVKGPNNVPLK